METFEGQVAVVTGGASGIGRATVERLMSEGARVTALDREEHAPPEDASGRVVAAVADITDQQAVDDAVATTMERWGRIDVLVNAAGIGAVGTVLDNDDDEWSRVMDVNVLGTVRVIRSVLPHMIAAGSGSVVNVVSVVAGTGFPNRALYSATKGAVASLTRAMATDHLRNGIRVNAVSPGTTDTPWVERLLAGADDPERERRNLEARQPHGRLVSATEVADAIAHLASPLAASTTGVTLSVDAGTHSLYTAR